MSKRTEMREKRQRAQRTQRIVWIGLFAVLVVALAALFILPNLPKSRPPVNGLSMGDPNAPVQIQEFADFQCPGCGYYYLNVEPEIVKKYIKPGKVYYTFTPLSFLGNESVQAAKAAYCANEEGKFWDFHDKLFGSQNGENQGAFADTNLLGFAEDVRIKDMDAFKQCLASDKYDQQLADNDQLSQDLSVTSTPAFIVNGQLTPLDQLESAIDTILASQ
ncbi:MAG TPA: DsbA family protein [Anaerolineaceae bacterium]|nr:DsbA family protein [Anaerolineaceae bacterium]